MFFTDNNLPMGIVVITNNFTDCRNLNAPCRRIFNAHYRCRDNSLYLGFLKTQVCVNHFAFNQFQSLAITQRLCTDNLAVLKSHILTIPCKIFSLDGTIPDHNILSMPEGVFRVKRTVLKYCILDILERIFALHLHIVKV